MPIHNDTQRPHPAFEKSFRAYSNYLVELAAFLERGFGSGPAVPAGVHAAVIANPATHRIQRHPLQTSAAADFHAGLRKGWGFLRRVQREVEEPDFFDEEANALLPYSSWYAVHHVGRAFAAASRQTVPHNHLALMHDLARTVVTRGLLPLPWGAWCEGCPQLGSHRFRGIEQVKTVHVLSAPDATIAKNRLAMLLRTTRAKDLEKAFEGLRKRKGKGAAGPGRLSREEKLSHAERFAPTTVFDFLYRLRTRASYGEADMFVLGSRDQADARRFALALALVCDATVAALESLISLYVGPQELAEAAVRYTDRTGSTLVGARAAHWLAIFDPGVDEIPF